jgi:hypothetical protein
MTMKTPEKKRESIRKSFRGWRKKEGLSIQAVVDAVNLKKGEAILSNAQVTAWEVRGNQPEPEAAESVRAVFPNCPI